MARVLLPLLLVLTALTGCQGDDQPTDSGADRAAGMLAAALAQGELSPITWTGSNPQKEYDAVVAGLDGLEPRVVVEQVTVSSSGTSARASLAWTWPVGEQEWSYTSQARMTKGGPDGWRTAWDPAIVEPELGADEVLDRVSVTPRRGKILGAGGRAIVQPRAVERIGLDKTKVSGAKAVASARELAGVLDIDGTAFAKLVKASGDSAFVEGLVLREADLTEQLSLRVSRIKGGLVVQDTLPLAPTRDFAAPILGRVGPVTAEMIKKNPDTYSVGDEVGLSGLQARYDDQLRGTPGVVIRRVGAGSASHELFAEKPVAGQPLKLTLDPRLQSLAERLLANVGPASALVAIRPSTGDILAAANGPGNGGLNLATYGQFAPGSTFKSVSSLALLRSGLRPDSLVDCPPSVVVDGKRFENYDDYPPSQLGRIPFRTALANSCNTAFIGQRLRLSRDGLTEAASSLGLGVDHDLGFPAYFGNVSPADSETGAAANMIGQGTILASPMVMATVIASIEAGHTVVPTLIPAVDGGQAPGPQLTTGEDAALKTMLRQVVTGGSGIGLLDVPGPPLIAKTGTAEYDAPSDSGGSQRKLHAWMIAGRPDLAVAVFVETGDSGSGTAGPILEAFLRGA
jgi:cell division protein FtsI/penicillin-binding protein 2